MSELACCRVETAVLSMFLTVTFVTALFFRLSLTLTFFLFLSFIKAGAAARSFKCNKAATSWGSGISGGQGSRSVSSFPRSNIQHYQHQQHLRHYPQSTHTCYTYSPANLTVSTSVNRHFIIGALVCPTLFVFFCESSLVCLEVKKTLVKSGELC